jgi:peptidoglycan/LPS O-acetylase OafA/YrhL
MDSGAVIIMVGFWGGVLAYPILQFIAVKRMRGGWRVLAYLPLILMAFVFLITIVGFYQQSNLWPLILILVSPLVLVYLVILLVSHSFVVRGNNEEQKQT